MSVSEKGIEIAFSREVSLQIHVIAEGLDMTPEEFVCMAVEERIEQVNIATGLLRDKPVVQ